jgi:hypothetical protein
MVLEARRVMARLENERKCDGARGDGGCDDDGWVTVDDDDTAATVPMHP